MYSSNHKLFCLPLLGSLGYLIFYVLFSIFSKLHSFDFSINRFSLSDLCWCDVFRVTQLVLCSLYWNLQIIMPLQVPLQKYFLQSVYFVSGDLRSLNIRSTILNNLLSLASIFFHILSTHYAPAIYSCALNMITANEVIGYHILYTMLNKPF